MITSTTCSYKWDKGGFGSYVALWALVVLYLTHICSCSVSIEHARSDECIRSNSKLLPKDALALRLEQPGIKSPTFQPAFLPEPQPQQFLQMLQVSTLKCWYYLTEEKRRHVWARLMCKHLPTFGWHISLLVDANEKLSLSFSLWLLSPLTHPLWLCLKGSCSPLKELFRG